MRMDLRNLETCLAVFFSFVNQNHSNKEMFHETKNDWGKKPTQKCRIMGDRDLIALIFSKHPLSGWHVARADRKEDLLQQW